ncbi:MAG TPA: tetratricopeptide repeat protein [Myxococcota bacterium]|nr:tetratricopeptide repeat protein [Myxococcota bacterium]
MTRNSRHSLACALGAALLAAGAAGPARADDPPCVVTCRDMAAKNQLKSGMSEMGCVASVCQQEGRRLYTEGNYDAALKSLSAVGERLSRSPSFMLDRGLVYYSLGKFDLALADFDGILLTDPDSFQAGAQRAHTLVRLSKLGDARTQFEKLLTLPGAKREFRGLRTESYLQGNIGVIDLIDGERPKAEGELKKAIEIDGSNGLATTYVYRVLPQMDKKNIDSNGVYLLLTASEDVGIPRRDAARETIETLVQKYPKFPETYFLAAELYRNTGHYEECERLLTVGERAIPEEPDIKAERLRCTLLRVGPTSEAAKGPIAELKKLAAEHPDDPLTKKILEALDLY